MFDFFRNKTTKDFIDDSNNVYNLPKPKAVPYVEVPEPSASKPSPTVYQIGKTEDGKVTLSLGNYTSIIVTMNNAGVDHLIRMLEAAKEPEYGIDPEPTDDPDGGEAIPELETKVA